MRFRTNSLLTSFAAALASTQLASAATLAINVGGNSTIRLNIDNQGASQVLQAGDLADNVANTELIRTVVDFDLSNPLLSGATINSATVTFTVRTSDGSSEDSTITLNLHQLSSSFVQGDGTVGSGVTWTSRDGTNNWTTAGGDFGGILASASGNPKTATPGSTLNFSGTSLTSEVEGAIGGNIYLILKSATEDLTARNLFNLASSRNASPTGNPYPGPVLTLDYTPAVPEPSAALLGSLGILVLLRRRR